LLPFAIQFSHAYEKHEYSACHAQHKAHFDMHEVDCSVFHFKINNNTLTFIPNFLITDIYTFDLKIYSIESEKSSVNLYYKSTRAPPLLLNIA